MTPDYRVRGRTSNASKRLKEAAAEKAEGDKVSRAQRKAMCQSAAEAEAESKYLASQRQAPTASSKDVVRLHVERADQGRQLQGRRRPALITQSSTC